jgi:hypothetical protein
MLSGIALTLSELPLELIAQHGLERRICDRGGEREVQFLFADADRLLPAWRDGRLEILRWGSRRGESALLPCTAWTQIDTVENGGWGERGVEPVVMRELAEAGSDAAGVLRNALANMPSAEMKRRIEDLLDRLSKGGDPERLRCPRALEVMERIGTSPAKDLLHELARKELSADLAEEVRASLQRLGDDRKGATP